MGATLSTATRILKITFLEATMTASQKAAYETLSEQLHYWRYDELNARDTLEAQPGHDTRTDTHQKFTVPAGMTEKDAQKALKLIKLECNPRDNFSIMWEKTGKTTRMIEKRAQSPAL